MHEHDHGLKALPANVTEETFKDTTNQTGESKLEEHHKINYYTKAVVVEETDTAERLLETVQKREQRMPPPPTLKELDGNKE